jgi:hypothetical protein
MSKRVRAELDNSGKIILLDKYYQLSSKTSQCDAANLLNVSCEFLRSLLQNKAMLQLTSKQQNNRIRQ